MKRLVPLTTALVSSVSLAWGAGPQDRSAASKPPDPVFDASWAGAYAGASIGHLSLNDGVSAIDTSCPWDCAAVLGLSDDSDGVIGGVQLGYNWRSGPILVGLEADISAISASGMSALATVRGRFGFVSDRSLFYVTGGLAEAEIRHDVNGIANLNIQDSAKWRTGWIAGGGWEYSISPGWSLKAEALYYDFGDDPVSFVYSDKGVYYTDGKFHNDGYLARIGLNYHFGAPAGLARTGY